MFDLLPFLPAAKPRRSMDDKKSVGGGVVVHICLLGKFCENLVKEDEVCCKFISLENLAKFSVRGT